jgi:hypothetical protein
MVKIKQLLIEVHMLSRIPFCPFILLLMLALAAGCKPNPPQTNLIIHSIFPVGRLLAGQTCKLKVISNVESLQGQVNHVAADLSMLGGDAAQELTQKPDGTWRWEGQVQPAKQGAMVLTVTATDTAGNQAQKELEIQVYVPGKAIAISGGFYHSLALKDDGTVLCWGDPSSFNECGDMPADLEDVVAIDAGDVMSVAIKYDGTVACWDGTDDSYTTCDTVLSAGLTDIVASSEGHIFLKADGTVKSPFCDQINTCDAVNSLKNIIAIVQSIPSCMALKSDGTVTIWGFENDDVGQFDVPAGLKNVVGIGGGYNRFLALKLEGSVAAWGGSKQTPNRNQVVPPGLGKLKAISAKGNDGSDLNVGLRQNGTMVAWVRGRGDFFYRVIEGPSNVVAVAAGWRHYIALLQDGSVGAWGNCGFGQCDVPAELQ